MTTKADLYRLIDALPDDVLPTAERFLSGLEEDAAAPYTPLDEAPEDDEPLTPEELAGVEAARAEYRAGKWRSLADVRADLARRRG